MNAVSLGQISALQVTPETSVQTEKSSTSVTAVNESCEKAGSSVSQTTAAGTTGKNCSVHVSSDSSAGIVCYPTAVGPSKRQAASVRESPDAYNINVTPVSDICVQLASGSMSSDACSDTVCHTTPMSRDVVHQSQSITVSSDAYSGAGLQAINTDIQPTEAVSSMRCSVASAARANEQSASVTASPESVSGVISRTTSTVMAGEQSTTHGSFVDTLNPTTPLTTAEGRSTSVRTYRSSCNTSATVSTSAAKRVASTANGTNNCDIKSDRGMYCISCVV